MTEKDAARLDVKDVERLLKDPSEESRAATAAKVAHVYEAGGLTEAEKVLGQDIFRAMARDASERVRAALSANLRQSRDLPREIALALARDVEAVALPMLEGSAVLEDADLIEIIGHAGRAAQAAVARRDGVSSSLAEALVERGDATVVATLMANATAVVSEPLLQRSVDRFGADEAVQKALVERANLPVTVAERLVAMVSESLRAYLVTHHELTPATATDLLVETRERAMITLLPISGAGLRDDGVDVERLVEQLHVNGRLTETLILRSLSLGDMGFFEASLARLANVPLVNARILIHDKGALGLEAIYKRSKLSPSLFSAFQTAIEVLKETTYDGGDRDRERFMRRVLERILTQSETMSGEMLDYLVAKLERLGDAA